MISAEGSYPTAETQTLTGPREGNSSWKFPTPWVLQGGVERLQELLQRKHTHDSDPLPHDPTGGKNDD